MRLGVIIDDLLAQFHNVTFFGPVRKLLVKFFLIVLTLLKDLCEECGRVLSSTRTFNWLGRSFAFVQKFSESFFFLLDGVEEEEVFLVITFIL